MRAVLSLLAVSLLVPVLCAPPAIAADVPPTDQGNIGGPSPVMELRGAAMLQLSPMYKEIRDTLAVINVREKQLLVDLAAAKDDATAEAIVRELESVPLERVLSILRIQARYARHENRPELERSIRLRMLELQGAGNI
jgi:hypothetical protein